MALFAQWRTLARRAVFMLQLQDEWGDRVAMIAQSD
jgi:hypothetical protein